MRIELGGPIVVERRGEDLVWDLIHLAASERRRGPVNRLADCNWPPLEWPSLCGLSGYLYAYGGLIRRAEIRFCRVCMERSGGVAVSWDAPSDLTIAA